MSFELCASEGRHVARVGAPVDDTEILGFLTPNHHHELLSPATWAVVCSERKERAKRFTVRGSKPPLSRRACMGVPTVSMPNMPQEA